MKYLPLAGLMLGLLGLPVKAADWFDEFRTSATAPQLYQFLHAMPKGGDLHNHLSGSGFPEWWYALATDKKTNGGYQYYTKIRINNCREPGGDMFGFSPYLLLFRTIQESTYDRLPACEKAEFQKLEHLTSEQKTGWMNSLALDKAHEGRDEFFQTHWQRLADLTGNPFIMAELLFLNMREFGREGLIYLETMEGTRFYQTPDGQPIEPDAVAGIFRQRLQQADAIATGVTVRMQYYLLRFIADAEQDLEWIYHFVHRNRDLFTGINMVGREDNDKGYPLRFLPVLRKLRRDIPAIPLAIHAGEVDEPNHHVRDTLLIGAERIGHGINLITDPDTMLLMRNSRNLVEINLISNMKLNYVNQFKDHPFPEYLRFGIPVTLSTDDRGMWLSNMTDEYFVAVTEFNLSWAEIRLLLNNSIEHAFVEAPVKAALRDTLTKRLNAFERNFRTQGMQGLPAAMPRSDGFICQRYGFCSQ
ncbi:MAG: adenosine deaminase [Saccharospirillaceae bacterium]|nr:adenosine deaminase [Saccharospirillaceae bacterium]MCD8532437.1 adenosine deaminase [Saccharospirillaceae bacterium]